MGAGVGSGVIEGTAVAVATAVGERDGCGVAVGVGRAVQLLRTTLASNIVPPNMYVAELNNFMVKVYIIRLPWQGYSTSAPAFTRVWGGSFGPRSRGVYEGAKREEHEA